MIYYVEDDDNIRELVVYTLMQMNMPCRGFAEGKTFRAAIAEEKPDLVLLDIKLPIRASRSSSSRRSIGKKGTSM